MSWRTVIIVGSVTGFILGAVAYVYLSMVGNMIVRESASTEPLSALNTPYCDAMYYDNGVQCDIKLDVSGITEPFDIQPAAGYKVLLQPVNPMSGGW